MINKIKISIITTFVAMLFQMNVFGMDQLTAFVDSASTKVKSDLIQHHASAMFPIAEYQLFVKHLLKSYPVVYRIDKPFAVSSHIGTLYQSLMKLDKERKNLWFFNIESKRKNQQDKNNIQCDINAYKMTKNCPYLIRNLQYNFIIKLKELHASDKNEKIICDSDISSIANLWNALVSFKEVTIINPKFKKKLQLHSHPDKFLINDNKRKMNTLFIYLTTTPALDFLPLALEYKPQLENPILKNIRTYLESLKKKDDNGDLILEEDVLAIAPLWNAFKSSCNYNWLDRITNPFEKYVTLDEMQQIQKELRVLSHSDRRMKKNIPQLEEIYKQFDDISRPVKPLDKYICFAAFEAFNQSAAIIIDQPLDTLKTVFSSACGLKTFDTTLCEQNTKRYEKIIKLTEQRIQQRRDLIQDALKNRYNSKN